MSGKLPEILISSPAVVVVAALVEEGSGGERRVFMARRSPEAGHGGLWELPGGKLEPGEDPKAAIAREIREELGVGLEIEGNPSSYESRIGAREFLFIVFPARFLSFDFKLAAHDSWDFYPASSLASLDLAPLDGPALRDWAARG
jgi:ADP-ribose pyrophosphatase